GRLTYAEARRALERLPSLDVKPGLDRILRLLDALDHPEQAFPAVHIAGTNGKGSVAAMLASVLSQAGYRVGRFTSPDLIDFRDRISIDDAWIEGDELARTVEQLLPIFAAEDPPTLFEALTAIAFHHFAKNKVDLAVVEVGLGGRFDATNVLSPLLTILTTVGRDHLALLGGTIEKIAWEKAGIAKEDVPCLAGDLPLEAQRILVAECARLRAPLTDCHTIDLERVAFDWEKVTYRIEAFDFPKEILLPLLGGYQQENLRVTLRAIELLREDGLTIPNHAVASGLAVARWPGRFEVISRRPLVILDGAHNQPGALALAEDIERTLPDQIHRHLLFGILSDKELEPIARALFPLFSSVTLTRPKSPRAMALDPLLEAARSLGIVPLRSTSVREGATSAYNSLKEDDALVVTGSLTVVREARPILLEELCRR
ncbi:MAG: folylpolyglutamate synthase/dihydrofolate synthase family protein, partial [Candidatus Bipolaricaulota bacterium]|nr:folylpolyglutamate synthase/dihydrofolate synthase family protein [Candidatus Bipolaricaulota bacterium]